MFKSENVHHYKNPFDRKRMRKVDGLFGGTVNINANGLNCANAAQNQLIAPRVIEDLFKQDGAWTLEFYLEVNSSNKAGDNYIWSFGKAGTATNYGNLRLVTGRINSAVYGSNGIARAFATTPILTEGMHKVSVSYAGPSDHTNMLFVIDGTGYSITGTGAGTGVIVPQAASTGYSMYVGGNTWAGPAGTSYHFNGRIKQFHYSQCKRSLADMILRQDGLDKMFPVDKYSAIDWNSDSGLKMWTRKTNPARKYG